MRALKPIALLLTITAVMGFSKIESEKFSVEILQNGVPVEIADSVVVLDKNPFQLRITLKQLDGVFMSASYTRDYFDLKESETIKDYEWLNQKTRAENNFNEDKELVIDDESVSYLFYDTTLNWHRFDKEITVAEGNVVATKTIQQFSIEDAGVVIPLKKAKAPVYLFFTATDKWIAGSPPPKELGRIKLKLVWR